MCDEEEFINKDESLNEDIHQIVLAGDYMEPECWTITKRADESNIRSPFCRNDLYKIPAGQFIVGIAGGIFDPIYVGRISDYAVLKYRRRFLKQTCRRLIFFKNKK